MMRILALALLILAYPLSSALGEDKTPAADNEMGLVKVEVQGKLVRKDGRYCVQARNPVFDDAFLVQLVRTEDKNQALGEDWTNWSPRPPKGPSRRRPAR